MKLQPLLCVVVVALVSLAPGRNVYAEPEGSALRNSTASGGVSVTTPGQAIREVEQRWSAVALAASENNLRAAEQSLAELTRAREQAGVESLEEYSLTLLEFAQAARQRADYEASQVYLHHALQLSKRHPRVIAKALPLALKIDSEPLPDLVMRLVRGLFSYPSVALEWFVPTGYLVLFGTGAGIAIVLALTLVACALGCYPGGLRRVPLVTVFLAGSAFLGWQGGYWWALVGMGLSLALLQPQRASWLLFLLGVQLLAWELFVPYAETVRHWSQQRVTRLMLQVLYGDYSPIPDVALEGRTALFEDYVTRQSENAAVWYAYGTLLKREGELDQAGIAFSKAEIRLGNQGWTTAARAGIEALNGRIELADQLMQEAAANGASGAEFWFNLSRIKFELMDTEGSREYFRKALKAAPELVTRLNGYDEAGTESGIRVWADVPLPFSSWYSTLFHETLRESDKERALRSSMAQGLSQHATIIASFAVFILALALVSRSQKVKVHAVAPLAGRVSVLLFDILPAGYLVRRACMGIAALSLSLIMILVALYLAGSSEYQVIVGVFEGGPLLAILLGLSLAAFPYVLSWIASMGETLPANNLPPAARTLLPRLIVGVLSLVLLGVALGKWVQTAALL
jgi:tetratricopeptide (TPR) repeat protein